MTDNFARLLALMGAGGSGGTKDYEALTNKPSINGTTLIGDVTLAELGIVVDDQLSTTSTNPVQNAILTALLNAFPYANVTGKPQINGVTLTGNITLSQLGLNAIWVGTRAELTAALANNEIADGTLIFLTDEPDVDNLPTQNSTNLVYSGGVWTALQGKENVFRFTTMPQASQTYNGLVVQFIGITNNNYTNGYFYECIENSEGGTTTYSWVQKNIQPEVLAVEEVNTLPTTGIKTKTLYVTPRYVNSDGYIDETNDYFYVLSAIHSGGTTIALYYKYIYSTGIYDSTIRPDESLAEFQAIYDAIQNNTFPAGTCNVEVVEGDNRKKEYINLDGTSNGWELIGNNVDNELSATSTNPVENRIVTQAINRFNNLQKVKATCYSTQAMSGTKTQAQIDDNYGIMIDTTGETFIRLEGNYTVDYAVNGVEFNVSGVTKNTTASQAYDGFIPDWYIRRVETGTTPEGTPVTIFHIDFCTCFYEPDEVRNLANGASLTRAGGDTYSKDANGNITYSIPAGYWQYFIACYYHD